MNKKQKTMLIRIVITSIFLASLSLINFENNILRFCLYMALYLIIGYDIIKKSLHGIINFRPFDENLLMMTATLGAIGLGLYNETKGQQGDFNEAIAVMLFYQVGEFFQKLAINKSRKNIASLMDIRPDYANIEKDNEIIKVDPSNLEIGSIIIVAPGEKIPIDGIIIEGNSSLNESALTGESKPRTIKKDDEVYSGSINLNGLIKIKTIKSFGESTASKIIELVENASNKKSKSENFISKFAKIYTPIVVFCALALVIIPPLFIKIILHNDVNFSQWIYRALTFLVISCPCALIISIPLSFFSGIGCASSKGILIKGSNYIENLSKLTSVVFDKTGTLTKGVFELVAIHHNKIDENKLLEYVLLAESASSHPIAISIRNFYKKELNKLRISNIEEISGQGVIAKIDELEVIVGNEQLMKNHNIEPILCHSVGTIVHIAINGEYMGHIVISDVIKEQSYKAIENLKKLNIKNIIMLTGDIEKVAKNVADELKIDKYYSNLLPNQKIEKIESLMEDKTENKTKNKKNILAFVGDGINDAPSISRADIGIAMGSIGTDAALEAADVVLMDDNPIKVATAVEISKKCLKIVKENIIFAIGIKLICLILGAIGIANMWLAIFADVGVMILCIINSFRVLLFKSRFN